MFDGKQFGQEIVGIVKSHVEKTLAPLLGQIEAMRKEIDVLKGAPPAKDGEDGRSITVEDVAPFILGEIAVAKLGMEEFIKATVDVLPKAENGKDADPETVKAMIDEAVAALPPAENGKDADPEQVASLVKEEAERILSGWDRPKDGQDGAPGEKGADGLPGINGRDGLDAMDVMVDREGALVFTMSDGRMKNVGLVVGKDGAPGKDGLSGERGKDGADAVGFDDMDLVETEQGVFLRFTRGEVVKDFRLPIVTDRGVFKEGTEYRKGDGVTWGGSFFIAQETTSEKPDSGKGFRLAVKRGRDGKDGQIKPARENTPVKVG